MKKTQLTLLAALLTACGGGGGRTEAPVSAPSNVAPAAPKPWALTEINSAGSVQSQALGCGSYDIIARGDLNNDGHDDILIGPKARYQPQSECSDPGFTKPIAAYYDPAAQAFKVNTATQAVMPEMQWTQAGVIADFNNDGYSDIFAVGTGTDYGQPCGEAPILLLGSAAGLVNMSHLLPRFSMYSHQATWGDFNGDGKTDFAIFNNDWVPTQQDDAKAAECSYRRFPGSNESFLITSAGNAWTYSALRISDENSKVLIDGRQSFNSAVAGDINNDGKTDIVVSGSNWGSLAHQTHTLLGNGQGGFIGKSIFVEKPFGDATVAASMSLRQLDGAGSVEMLINYAEHPGGPERPFQKSLYKVFTYSLSTWSNVTDQYLTNKNSAETDLTFCPRIYWADLNSDSMDDFVCTTINSLQTDDTNNISPRIWLRTADNRFEPAYHRDITLIGKMASPTPVKVDGKVKIAGLRNNSYKAAIQIDLAE